MKARSLEYCAKSADEWETILENGSYYPDQCSSQHDASWYARIAVALRHVRDDSLWTF